MIARSLTHLNEANLPLPVVAVFPDHNSWNDYGRNFFAKLHVQAKDGATLQLHLRMMFEGVKRSEHAFEELLREEGEVFPIDRVTRPFISLIPDVNSYREVIGALGFELGVSALRKLKDAVVIRTEGNDESLRLVADEEFHIGILRHDGAYAALRRGGRHFRRDMPEPVDDVAIDFVFGARLKCANNPYIVPFRFKREGIFRDRISVLIGRNGVGKTQLLKSIVDGLHDGHPDGFFRPHFRPAIKPSRVLVFSSVPTDPFPRSIGAWFGVDYEYFAVNASREDGAEPLLSSLVACKKDEDHNDFCKGQHQSRIDIIRDALEQIGLWPRLYLPLRPRRTGDQLPHVLEVNGESYFPLGRRVNELNSLRLIQQIDWGRSVVILDTKMQPRDLSSGEYAMLRFVAQVASAIEQGSLLLLDEPETHLHPNFVSDLMEILDKLLQSTGSVAIIATHSAYVVRETPRRRVNILTLKDREIVIDTPRMQTFGASIDTISQFVFGDTNLSHRFQKTLATWANEIGHKLGIEGVVQQFGTELNPESLSFIAHQLRQPPKAD